MADTVTQNSPTFVEKLASLPELRPFPQVALRLMKVCDDPQASARDLVEIIRYDPSLSLQMLKLANSSLYGCSGKIKSVEQATVVLGFRAVKNMAVTAAAAGVFAEGNTAVAARKILWEHSLACATVARLLAYHVEHVDPDEAFVAGIVHDVGKLIFFDYAADQYQFAPRAVGGIPTIEQEREDFGVTHQEIGNRCGQEWGLPGEINQAVTFHHAPLDADFSQELVGVIAAANRLSKTWGMGVPPPAEEIDELEMITDLELPLEPACLAEIRQAAPDELSSVTEAMTP